MVKILIVAATEGEVNKITDHFELIGNTGNHLKHYRFQDTEIDVLISGVGMIATAYHLGKQLANSFYTMTYNLGVCGSFNREINLETVVHVTSDCFPEMGAEDGDNFLSIFDIGLLGKDEFPFKDGMLFSYHPPQVKALNKIKQVKGITVNTVHGNDESIRKVIDKYHPDVESMEGAAFLYSCLNEQIPCAQIRAVSNYVERRNRDTWKLDLAIENLTHSFMDILSEITTD
jgi:futalosine hydrolase